MEQPSAPPCTAFAGTHLLASGELSEVILKAKEALDRDPAAAVLIFDDASRVFDVDFRGTAAEVLQRLEVTANATAPRGPGRPKLGVVAREVTLLPRHWDWLASQPGGASVALRKLVDGARRANDMKDRIRKSQEAAYRFMSIMAGNEAGFEEAARALFAGSETRFCEMTESWPADVQVHARKLAAPAFEQAKV